MPKIKRTVDGAWRIMAIQEVKVELEIYQKSDIFGSYKILRTLGY